MSAAVHALSYAGIAAQERFPAVWALHVGVFVVFIPLVLAVTRCVVGGRIEWRRLVPYFPRWTPVLVSVGMAYVMANFFLSMRHLPWRGEAAAGDVETAEERLYEIRLFSGHWLIFYGVPALFFLYVPAGAPPRIEESSEEEAAI